MTAPPTMCLYGRRCCFDSGIPFGWYGKLYMRYRIDCIDTQMRMVCDKKRRCVWPVPRCVIAFCECLSSVQRGACYMNRLRILVADDHEIVRRGLISLIRSHPDWEVCAEADNGRQAVEKANQSKPDIAILDIGMPVLNGLEATRQILREHPGVRILILTVTDTDQAVQAVLDAGARGFLLKSDAARDLVTAWRPWRTTRPSLPPGWPISCCPATSTRPRVPPRAIQACRV